MLQCFVFVTLLIAVFVWSYWRLWSCVWSFLWAISGLAERPSYHFPEVHTDSYVEASEEDSDNICVTYSIQIP